MSETGSPSAYRRIASSRCRYIVRRDSVSAVASTVGHVSRSPSASRTTVAVALRMLIRRGCHGAFEDGAWTQRSIDEIGTADDTTAEQLKGGGTGNHGIEGQHVAFDRNEWLRRRELFVNPRQDAGSEESGFARQVGNHLEPVGDRGSMRLQCGVFDLAHGFRIEQEGLLVA